jgi:hypothetical protein
MNNTFTLTKNQDGTFTSVITNGTITTTQVYTNAQEVQSKLLMRKQQDVIRMTEDFARQTTFNNNRIAAINADIATINAALAE